MVTQIKHSRDGPEKKTEMKQKIKGAINSNPLLKDFLLKENCYGKFISAIMNVNDIREIRIAYNSIINFNNPSRIISDAFIWSKTPQDREFWYNKHLKARKLYNNTFNKIITK